MLIFRGTAQPTQALVPSFGDGALCVAGTLSRIAVKPAPAGLVSYPEAAEPGLVALDGLVAGDVRTYQAWYRDTANFCTPDTFNFSNAVRIRWQ